MSFAEPSGPLSEAIKRYKEQLESVTIRGVVQEDKDKGTVRLILDVPSGAPPMMVEVARSHVIDITPDESGTTAALHLKRGADYVISIVAVAGLEDEIPGSIREVIERHGGPGGMR